MIYIHTYTHVRHCAPLTLITTCMCSTKPVRTDTRVYVRMRGIGCCCVY